MKNTILGSIGGFVLGILITMLLVFIMMPKMMMIENESKYSFDESATLLEESIKSHGWSLVTTHDLQKSMKKFDHDVKAVKVFEICHPDHAVKILAADKERVVSSLMPCRVAIYERNDGKTYISRMNSGLMAKTMGKLIKTVMADASRDSEEILEVILKD